MNGIFSATPGTGPIRLLVGTQGLLMAESFLGLLAPNVAGGFRQLAVLTLLLALGAMALAAVGLPTNDCEPYWRRRRGR